MSERILKVNKLIKQEVGEAILEELDFENNVIITVMKVDTSADLRHSNVFVSVMPKDQENVTLSFLNDNIYALQQRINKRLFMKPVPKIRFSLDLSGDYLDRINQIIAEENR